MLSKRDLIEDFIDSQSENLSSIELLLLDLEQDHLANINLLLGKVLSVRVAAEMDELEILSDAVLGLEQSLRKIRDYQITLDKELISLLLKAYDYLMALFQAIAADLDNINIEQQFISIESASILQTLEAHLKIQLNPIEKFSEIESIFSLRESIDRVANTYGKQVDLCFMGGDVLLPKLIIKRLPRLLTHLINNAIAHGIELPDVRESVGKPRVGLITLTATTQDNQAVITFVDDGAGIDVERVKDKAIKKGLIDNHRCDQLSKQDVFEFLFHPDFSTKDVRDMIAGTGFGLNIVREELNKIGGNIQVDSVQGQGTTFTLVYHLD